MQKHGKQKARVVGSFELKETVEDAREIFGQGKLRRQRGRQSLGAA